MTFDEIVAARRSIRQYKPDTVDDALVRQVLNAGRMAPSAKNEQRWRFTVVKDAALRGKLMDACFGQEMVAAAPCAVVVWAVDDRRMQCGHSAALVDCSIATSYMQLKATELGLGTCWVGMFDPKKVKQLLELDEQAVVLTVMPLGWPDEQPGTVPRVELDTLVDTREQP